MLANQPSTATYDLIFTVNSPTKTVTFKGNENGTGATIGANTTNNQSFAGWDITGMDDVTHEFGVSKTTNTSINKSLETDYKNLRSTDGTVNFKARWNSVATNLPSVTKTGYTCGWSITSGATTVSSITVPENNNGIINLYAVCNNNVYTITFDNQSATTSGTTKIYEAYGKSYSLTSGGSAVSTITKPTKTNYVFGGYYTGTNGSGTQVVDASGTIKTTNTAFAANTTAYAYWKPVVTVACTNCSSNPASKEADYNGSVTFAITANTGYTLTGATVSGSGCSLTNGTLTASNVTSPRTCTISLPLQKYTVAVTCSGCASNPTSASVDHGTSKTFTITASSGYTLTGATVSGTGCSLNGSTLTVTNVTSARTCSISAKSSDFYLYWIRSSTAQLSPGGLTYSDLISKITSSSTYKYTTSLSTVKAAVPSGYSMPYIKTLITNNKASTSYTCMYVNQDSVSKEICFTGSPGNAGTTFKTMGFSNYVYKDSCTTNLCAYYSLFGSKYNTKPYMYAYINYSSSSSAGDYIRLYGTYRWHTGAYSAYHCTYYADGDVSCSA